MMGNFKSIIDISLVYTGQCGVEYMYIGPVELHIMYRKHYYRNV